VPHGETVTPEKLRMIEAAENILRDLGFHEVRVRHHELGAAGNPRPVTGKGATPDDHPVARHPSPVTHLARIELGPLEIRRFLEAGISTKVGEALRGIGYAHVTLDLEGYRRAGEPVKLLARNGFR
jgi:uncharacterized protein